MHAMKHMHAMKRPLFLFKKFSYLCDHTTMAGKGGKGSWRAPNGAKILVLMTENPGQFSWEDVDAEEKIGVTLQRLTQNVSPDAQGDGKYHGFAEAFTLDDAVCKKTWLQCNITEYTFHFGGQSVHDFQSVHDTFHFGGQSVHD